MSAWGRTGRVELDGGAAPDVFIDGAFRGWCVRVDGGWFARVSPEHSLYAERLPSLDAAVMWVLRRAAPDVWRAERGPVWRVTSGPPGNCRGCKYHWNVHTPSGEIAQGYSGTGDVSGWRWSFSLARKAATS